MDRDWNIKGEDIYELFGRYGGIRQVRIGTDQKLGTKGTAYIVSLLQLKRPLLGSQLIYRSMRVLMMPRRLSHI